MATVGRMQACSHPVNEQLLRESQISMCRRVMKRHTKMEGKDTARVVAGVKTGLESLKHYLWYGMVAGHGHAVGGVTG